MEIDEYINNLNSDLDRQMQELNRSMNAALNMGSAPDAANAPEINLEGISFCPECGTRITEGCRFCPECGTRINNDDTCGESVNTLSDNTSGNDSSCATCRGILFTDTMTLADKYSTEHWTVLEMFNGIRQIQQEHGMDWQLLDAADYRKQLGKDPFWLDYNELLSDFMQKEGFKYGMNTPVFIIGGDDVIPIPEIEDTWGTSDNGKMPCDMSYCFPGHFFSDLWEGDRSISVDSVRNVISRLPLEDGYLDSDMIADILDHFYRCEEFYENGIPVCTVMMTSNSSWLPASKTMSEHLPLINHAEDEELVEDNMYVCPPVAPDNEDAEEPLELSLEEAGMLLFNLHGADKEGMSSFYSDEGEAFNKEMLKKTKARVFTTVACYGARYHGYERDDSMMLTALHQDNFVLYAGSLIPVPMTELNIPEGVEVHEGSGSEHLMPIYCMELFAGLPAGEAMMKAKLEYFNTFRHLERDDFSLATMQMFSLYGNPMLRLQRDEEVLRKAKEEHVLPVLPETCKNVPVRMKRMQRIMTKEKTSASLLADISNAVNNNLDAIHTAIANDLYAQLGLEPRMIDHIDAYSIPVGDGSIEKGYMYAYVNEDRAFDNKTWVEVDENGVLKRVIKTK